MKHVVCGMIGGIFVNNIRNFLEKIKHLWLWLPIIWQDQDWDYIYLYKIIVFKLKQMEKNHQEEQIIADWQRVITQMAVARNCLQRHIDDEYPGFKEWCETKDRKLFSIKKFERDEQMKQEDLELFAKIFVKHSRGWWS